VKGQFVTKTENPRALEEMGGHSDARLSSPSSARNKGPLLEALSAVLPISAHVLEIASGTGEHAVHLCTAMPGLSWQPTDIAEEALASIEAWRLATGLENMAAPISLDVTEQAWWERIEPNPSIILSCNMIHIAPWEAGLGAIAGAGALLPSAGMLIFYGPFSKGGIHNAPSNEAFDASLKSRDPSWGVRDIDDISAAAADAVLDFEMEIPMPADNRVLIYRKVDN